MKKRFMVGLVVTLASLAGAPLLAATSPAADAASSAAAKKSSKGKTKKAKRTKKGKTTHNVAHVKKGGGAAPAQGPSKS
jgi:hypothetical protein